MLKERKAHLPLTRVAQKRCCNEVDAWVEYFILITPTSLDLVSLLIGMREQDQDKTKKISRVNLPYFLRTVYIS